MQPRYIVENGLLKINPSYNQQAAEVKQENTVANPDRALVCQYNFVDASAAAEVTGGKLADSTQKVINNVQDMSYTNQFGAGSRVDGGELLNSYENVFTHTLTPIGLSEKLMGLAGYALDIKVDDSGSMGTTCNNGLTRWQNVKNRLLQLINYIQLVPTRTITISFLDRNNTIILDRNGKTPSEFLAEATAQINHAFRRGPDGGTPIYGNVQQMLSRAEGKTAHYLFTDGQPNGYGNEDEDKEAEILDTKNLLLNRRHPKSNPFTFLCCSDNPRDTLWMHEIEEIACRPNAPGYVAALQNFAAEKLEVLNDQGPEFPYSESLWMLCNLTAAMNPNDLDALDQHAPLSKPTLDNLIGRVCTLTEYESYFNQHPNANWLFGEDYELFLTTTITNQIPSVARFENVLAQMLNNDINNGNDTSEFRDIARAEETIIQEFGRNRSPVIRKARQDFWNNHYLQMETAQINHVTRYGQESRQIRQDLWGDYVASSRLGEYWQSFVGQFNRKPAVAVEQVVVSEQPSAPVIGQPLQVDATQAPVYTTVATNPPPDYAVSVQSPAYVTPACYAYTAPTYSYPAYIKPASSYAVSQAPSSLYASQPSSSSYSSGYSTWPSQQQYALQQPQQQTQYALQSQSQYDPQQDLAPPKPTNTCCNIM